MTKQDKDDILNLSGDAEMRSVELTKATRAVEDARQALERSRSVLIDYLTRLISKETAK